jgi:hypothetical protein
LLREGIDIGRLFVGKVDLEGLALHLILRRCKNNLVEFCYCQLQGVMVKLAKDKGPEGVTTYVKITYHKVHKNNAKKNPNNG